MIWSVSDDKTFRRCQRQLYYRKFFANSRSQDPQRREAFRLKRLTSLYAWRGKLVDEVISSLIVPAVSKKRTIKLREVRDQARRAFDQQWKIASGQVAGTDSAALALHRVEYGPPVTEEELKNLWSEIEEAFRNLFHMRELADVLKSAHYVIAQRSLCFPIDSELSVRAVPDLIAFYGMNPPVIVDWKVKTEGIQDAWLQLAIYAMALRRCVPHKDFPSSLHDWLETDIRIYEVQLLTNQVRTHVLLPEEVLSVENRIAGSAEEIQMVIDGRDFDDLTPTDFKPAYMAETCQSCAFRPLCWEYRNDRTRNQYLFN
jgi:hypothetical protein